MESGDKLMEVDARSGKEPLSSLDQVCHVRGGMIEVLNILYKFDAPGKTEEEYQLSNDLIGRMQQLRDEMNVLHR